MKNKKIYLKGGLKAVINNIGKNRWQGTILDYDITCEAKNLNELIEDLNSQVDLLDTIDSTNELQ